MKFNIRSGVSFPLLVLLLQLTSLQICRAEVLSRVKRDSDRVWEEIADLLQNFKDELNSKSEEIQFLREEIQRIEQNQQLQNQNSLAILSTNIAQNVANIDKKFTQMLSKSEKKFEIKLNQFESKVNESTTSLEQSLESLEMRSTTKLQILDSKIKKSEASLKTTNTQQDLEITQLKSDVLGFQKVYNASTTQKHDLNVELARIHSKLFATSQSVTAIEAHLTEQRSIAEEIEATVAENLSRHAEQLVSIQKQVSRISAILPKHNTKVAFFDHASHTGPTEVINFGTCFLAEECCQNLELLDDEAGSINTHGSCVVAYTNRSCIGESTILKPGVSTGPPLNHWNLNTWKDKISSVKPCPTEN